MAASTEAAAPSLSKDLRLASRRIHKLSNYLVNAKLIVLFTNRQLYARALSCFYYIFVALEEALVACKDHKDLKAFAEELSETGLLRTKAFHKDLVYYLGPDWAKTNPPSQAVQEYQKHLRALGASNPTLLLAHAYTQHLAMASGGQIVRRMARKHMQLPEDQGTSSFEYQTSPSLLKHNFFKKLDALGEAMSEDMKQKMVDEHIQAFKYNNRIMANFRIGWGAFLRGLVLLLPRMARGALLLLAVSLFVMYVWQRKHA